MLQDNMQPYRRSKIEIYILKKIFVEKLVKQSKVLYAILNYENTNNMSRVFFKTVNKPLLARKFTAGSTASSKKVAVVFGAGDATGASCCRAFAKDGFDVIAVRRNKGAFSGTLERMSTKFKSEGIDNVYGYAIDARKEEQVIQLLDEVETKFGPISLAIHNIGPNVGQSVLEGTTQRYQKMFEIAATSSLIVGREVANRMLKNKIDNGCIFFTGATSSLRGKSMFSAFASAMGKYI